MGVREGGRGVKGGRGERAGAEEGGGQMACLQHQVGQHHRAGLAARVDAHQRGAQRLRLVELAHDEVHPREREGALLVRVVVLERLLVRGARLRGVAQQLVHERDPEADLRGDLALRAQLVRGLDAHAREQVGLRAARGAQRLGRLVHEPLLLVDAREQQQRLHVQEGLVELQLGRLGAREQRAQLLLRLLVLLQLEVELGELVPQRLLRRVAVHRRRVVLDRLDVLVRRHQHLADARRERGVAGALAQRRLEGGDGLGCIGLQPGCTRLQPAVH